MTGLQIFGERLREVRMRHALTQNDLARELGVNRDCILKWENNQRFPRVEQLKSLCSRLSVSADWLLGFSDVRDLIKVG